MKVVGLVSGGKDSTLNLLKCIENNHTLVCLAHLTPENAYNSITDELDSFCFQSVGQNHVPLFAKCIGLPLYSRKLGPGTSLNTNLVYEVTAGDEVETLFELLNEVKKKHPDVQAVSVGAISSRYQRSRVENVCRRLNLKVLAYLWDQEPRYVLENVLHYKMKVVMVKIACEGLFPPENYLGRIFDVEFVEKLKSNPHLHAAGEGGEYETFTLDCPILFEEGYLTLRRKKIVTMNKDYYAPVAHLQFDIIYHPR